MNRIIQQQQENNRNSVDHWEIAESHRQRVMTEITRGVPRGEKRLCLLGAGNCNDVDLQALLSVFREVHVVDIDADALTMAVDRQAVADHDALILHGGVDLCGIAEEISTWSPDPPCKPKEVKRVNKKARNFPIPELPAPFVSSCRLIC